MRLQLAWASQSCVLSCSIPKRTRSWCGTPTTNKLSTSSFPSIPVKVLSVSATQCASLPQVERSALSSLVYTDQTRDNAFHVYILHINFMFCSLVLLIKDILFPCFYLHEQRAWWDGGGHCSTGRSPGSMLGGGGRISVIIYHIECNRSAKLNSTSHHINQFNIGPQARV